MDMRAGVLTNPPPAPMQPVISPAMTPITIASAKSVPE
jgi:hypothetical protein